MPEITPGIIGTSQQFSGGSLEIFVFSQTISGVEWYVAVRGTVQGIYSLIDSSQVAPGRVINSALAEANTYNLEVNVCGATYPLEISVTFPANDLILNGMGRATFFDGDALTTGNHAIVISGYTDCVVQDLSVQTEDGGGKTSNAIFIEDGADGFRIENVIVVDSDTNGIHVEGTDIIGGWITNSEVLVSDESAIYVNMDAGNTITDLDVGGCHVSCSQNPGLQIHDSYGGNFHNNIVHDINLGGGIWIYAGSYNNVESNNILNVENDCILLSDAPNTIVNDNTCYLCSNDGISLLNSDWCDITDNNILEISIAGIRLETNSDHTNMVGNFFYNCATLGPISVIFFDTNGGDDCSVVTNYIIGYPDCENYQAGVWLRGVDGTLIASNYIIDNADEGIALQTNNDNTHIIANTITGNGGYGIDISAASNNDTRIGPNYLLGNTLGCINDVGTNTKLPFVSFQFTEENNSTISTSSPTGINVIAGSDEALAWGQLPIEIQQIVKIKIWGVALGGPAAAGGQMHLEITFNAGASNAAYNTANKSWNITNHDSEEADYVANDVVHWLIENGDVSDELANLAAGDSFEIFAIYEGAASPDGESDVRIRVVEIEYV